MSRNRLHDKLIVIDLEATCDEPRPKWQSEIIEVGVCLLDIHTFEITDNEGYLVKPVNTPITPFCTKLTTITPELIAAQGRALNGVMNILDEKYRLSQRMWASWGDYDRNQLMSECQIKNIHFPGSRSTHLNLKALMALEYGWHGQTALDEALKRFNLTLEGTHHRGKDDAYNIAKIYAAHLKSVRGIK